MPSSLSSDCCLPQAGECYKTLQPLLVTAWLPPIPALPVRESYVRWQPSSDRWLRARYTYMPSSSLVTAGYK
jgi:hypothetical protein